MAPILSGQHTDNSRLSTVPDYIVGIGLVLVVFLDYLLPASAIFYWCGFAVTISPVCYRAARARYRSVRIRQARPHSSLDRVPRSRAPKVLRRPEQVLARRLGFRRVRADAGRLAVQF